VRKKSGIIKLFSVILVIVLLVGLGEWYALKSIRGVFQKILYRDALTSASTLIEACRTVYAFQLLREIERESLLIFATESIPDSIDREDLARITEKGRLTLAILTDREGNIKTKSGAITPEFYPWLNRVSENLPLVYQGINNSQLFGIDRELPLTEGPKGIALEVDNGILVLFSPEPTIKEREELTVGNLIRRLGENPQIRYLTLQDKSGFIFATKSVSTMSSLESDNFLQVIYNSGKSNSRFIRFSGEKIFEFATVFPRMGRYSGILRMGISAKDYDRLLLSYAIQLGIILILTIIGGIVVMAFISTSRRLAKQKGLSDAILSEMNAICVAIDNHGIVTLINPIAAKLFGVNIEDSIGKLQEDVFQNDPLKLTDQLRRKSGRVFREEIQTINGLRTYDISTGNLSDGGAYVVAEDVTDFIELRREVAQAEHLKSLGELAAGVAHEIRNPLNAIGIASQRLSNEFKPIEDENGYQNLLFELRSAIKRLDNVVREFIGLSAPMAPNMDIQPLNPLIQEIIADNRMQIEGSGLQFVTQIDDLGYAKIDPGQIKKALQNLIKNAVEATSSGGKIEIRAHRTDNQIKISIWDSGKPIPENIQGKIGKPFVSYGKETGTGIGLFTTYRIASDHGGKIEFESDKNGTEFRFILYGERA